MAYGNKTNTEGLLLHLSVLFQSWNVDAEDLAFVLHYEMRPVHPHFPKKQIEQRINSAIDKDISIAYIALDEHLK